MTCCSFQLIKVARVIHKGLFVRVDQSNYSEFVNGINTMTLTACDRTDQLYENEFARSFTTMTLTARALVDQVHVNELVLSLTQTLADQPNHNEYV